ncbi:MAG: bifunctional phosphopantothenoylcysteine decarboxylase/phosphopantothenate--cysteine ligase CoaBC, partial [Thermostichales cyanobacterium SZTDM-1c_bins_54]
AYKVCDLVSSLSQKQAQVRVMLTQGAEGFIAPLTLATLARHPAYTDREFWHHGQGRPLHIELGEWAEAVVIAPLTANTLSKMALGLADNLLTNVVLATAAPLLLAPAMNTTMWEQPAIQAHWQHLTNRYWTLAPASGRLACDAVGAGRLPPLPLLEETLAALLWTGGRQDWQGRQVLVTGGPTREFWDPVRLLTNPATGRMGLAVANAAAARGADVTYIYGGELPADPHPRVQRIPIDSAAELLQALEGVFPRVDTVFMAAAVSDVRPAVFSASKRPKQDLELLLPLEPVPDLLKLLAQRNQAYAPRKLLIGWAAQTGDPRPAARQKRLEKGLDAIIANPIDHPQAGFAATTNQGFWITADQEVALPLTSKIEMAQRILDLALTLHR